MDIPVLSWGIFFALRKRKRSDAMSWKLEKGGGKFYKL